MEIEKISKELVRSATVLGQWLNRICYLCAKEEKTKKENTEKDLRELKSRFICDFESTILASKSSVDLAQRVSTRAGRMVHTDMPAEVLPFLQAAQWGEIDHKLAGQMVISFMRIRSEPVNHGVEQCQDQEKSLIDQV